MSIEGPSPGQLWPEVVATYKAYLRSSKVFYGVVDEFLSRNGEVVPVLREGLRGNDRPTAANVVTRVDPDRLVELLPELVDLASFDHPDLERIRLAIRNAVADPANSLQVRKRLESLAAQILESGEEPEYRRLLELTIQVDPRLAHDIALRAVRSPEADIRDAGQQFLDRPELRRYRVREAVAARELDLPRTSVRIGQTEIALQSVEQLLDLVAEGRVIEIDLPERGVTRKQFRHAVEVAARLRDVRLHWATRGQRGWAIYRSELAQHLG